MNSHIHNIKLGGLKIADNEQGFAAVGKFIFVAPGDVKPNRITAAEVKYKSQVVFRQPTEAE